MSTPQGDTLYFHPGLLVESSQYPTPESMVSDRAAYLIAEKEVEEAMRLQDNMEPAWTGDDFESDAFFDDLASNFRDVSLDQFFLPDDGRNCEKGLRDDEDYPGQLVFARYDIDEDPHELNGRFGFWLTTRSRVMEGGLLGHMGNLPVPVALLTDEEMGLVAFKLLKDRRDNFSSLSPTPAGCYPLRPKEFPEGAITKAVLSVIGTDQGDYDVTHLPPENIAYFHEQAFIAAAGGADFQRMGDQDCCLFW